MRRAAGGGAIAWDASGNAYIAGSICGTAPGGTVFGILMRAPSGALSFVAGKSGGATTEGILAINASLSAGAGLAVDGSGNLWFAETNAHRIRRIDGSGNINTVAGTGAAGYFGDYVPLAQAQLNRPWSIQFLAGRHMAFTDSDNYAVRYVW